jgi:hypothetical protein
VRVLDGDCHRDQDVQDELRHHDQQERPPEKPLLLAHERVIDGYGDEVEEQAAEEQDHAEQEKGHEGQQPEQAVGHARRGEPVAAFDPPDQRRHQQRGDHRAQEELKRCERDAVNDQEEVAEIGRPQHGSHDRDPGEAGEPAEQRPAGHGAHVSGEGPGPSPGHRRTVIDGSRQ